MRTVLNGAHGVRQRTLAARLSMKIAQDSEYSKKIGVEDTSRYQKMSGKERKGDDKNAEFNYDHYSTDSLL